MASFKGKDVVHVEMGEGKTATQGETSTIFTNGLAGCRALAFDVRVPAQDGQPAQRKLIFTHYQGSQTHRNLSEARYLLAEFAGKGATAEAISFVADRTFVGHQLEAAKDWKSTLAELGLKALGSEVPLRVEWYPDMRLSIDGQSNQGTIALRFPAGDGPVEYYTWHAHGWRPLSESSGPRPTGGEGGEGTDGPGRPPGSWWVARSCDGNDAQTGCQWFDNCW